MEPPAVHVTPEPLLVDEEPRQSPEYGSHAEELPPAHSFLVPEGDQAFAEESPAQDAEGLIVFPHRCYPLLPMSTSVSQPAIRRIAKR